MALPQGSQIAGRPFREITAAELGILGAVINGGAGLVLQLLPWWAAGYSSCQIYFAFSTGPGETIGLEVAGFNSEGQHGIYDPCIDGNGAGVGFPPGGGVIVLAFDDGPLPGNWRPVQVIPQGPRSMPLNPTWNKAQFLSFNIRNLGATPLTVQAFTIQLGGR
jgi:hypothetical protein